MLMRKLYILFITAFLCFTNLTSAQFYQQYFDGADTSADYSILIDFGSDTNNIWQVGPPQKIIFHSPATAPNVLVTDTVNYYPINDTSSFTYMLVNPIWSWGIFALQWIQKIDYVHDFDGGIIEYTIDNGTTWENVFHNPYVYSFYGFDTLNVDTLGGTNYAFSGTDTSWRNVWLCFDMSFLTMFDTIYFRFTSVSDSMDTNKEGWMIDNMMAQLTWVHTVKSEKSMDYIKVYPTPTTGIVNIDIEKQQGFHIIENMELTDIQGRVVRKYGVSPTKFYIDIGDLTDGIYFLQIKTNIKSTTIPITLNKNR